MEETGYSIMVYRSQKVPKNLQTHFKDPLFMFSFRFVSSARNAMEMVYASRWRRNEMRNELVESVAFAKEEPQPQLRTYFVVHSMYEMRLCCAFVTAFHAV